MKTATTLFIEIIAALIYVQALYAQTSTPPSKIILEQHVGTNTCYVGEALPLTVTWSVYPPIGSFKAVDIRLPVMETNLFRIYDSYKTADKPNAQSLGIPLSGTRAIANLSTTKHNGYKYTTLKIKKIIIPIASGTQTLAPATITCARSNKNITNTARNPKGSGNLYQYPLYFNNNFFNLEIGPNDTHLQAISDRDTINVLPLPPAPPDLFNGLVGQYAFSVSITTNSIRQGDLLSLNMTVTGNGYLEHLKLPPLELQPGFTNSFRITADRRLSSINGNSISFSQTIYPRHIGDQALPQLAMHYFDPVTKKYTISESKEIKFTVKKANIIDGTIFGNQNSNENNRHYLIWILLALIAIVVTLLLMRRKPVKKTTTVITADPDKAFNLFSKNIADLEKGYFENPREQYHVLNSALGIYLSSLLTNHRPGAITLSSIEQLLISNNATEDTIKTARNLYKEIDRNRFSPVAPSTTNSSAISAAKELINKIHNHELFVMR